MFAAFGNPSDARPRWASWLFPFRVKTFVGYVIIDILCVGMGMGVPIFCILLGFPVGWFVGRRVCATTSEWCSASRQVLRAAVITSAVTFIIMGVLWGRTAALLFDPAFDLVAFGIPQILYTPTASFIGWLALMIFISPVLQMLLTVFGAHLVSATSDNREHGAA